MSVSNLVDLAAVRAVRQAELAANMDRLEQFVETLKSAAIFAAEYAVAFAAPVRQYDLALARSMYRFVLRRLQTDIRRTIRKTDRTPEIIAELSRRAKEIVADAFTHRLLEILLPEGRS